MTQQGGSTEWSNQAEPSMLLESLRDENGNRRRFGILECPFVSSDIEKMTYKLWFIGRCGIGKTAAINRLSGCVKTTSYRETSGIRTSNIYWPVKIWDQLLIFKLNCWECGYISGKKYSHIVPSCEANLDMVVVVFSFSEPQSLVEAKTILKNRKEDVAHIVLGVQFNPYKVMPIKISEVQELANIFQVEVATLEEFGLQHEGVTETSRIAPVLNAMCQTLWKHDQRYIMIQSSGIQV